MHSDRAGAEPSSEELCRRAQYGDRKAEEMLAERYVRLVRMCARPYFLAGADSEDLIQEGMLGLLKAIREYDPDKNASFYSFADLCIRRRIYSAIRLAAGGKHTPLNAALSLEEDPPLGEKDAADSVLSLYRSHDPEELVIVREAFNELYGALMGVLSGFEAKILGLYLQGFSYSEIAAIIKKPAKSVDNAVQRVRRKLARIQTTQSGDR